MKSEKQIIFEKQIVERNTPHKEKKNVIVHKKNPMVFSLQMSVVYILSHNNTCPCSFVASRTGTSLVVMLIIN